LPAPLNNVPPFSEISHSIEPYQLTISNRIT
jgi:hypothetical protein